jgi:hypothetical protein
MLPARLAPEDPIVLDSSHAILVVLEVTLLATVEALERVHPQLAEDPPRPLSAMVTTQDRIAQIVLTETAALLAAVRSYRAIAADDSDF